MKKRRNEKVNEGLKVEEVAGEDREGSRREKEMDGRMDGKKLGRKEGRKE